MSRTEQIIVLCLAIISGIRGNEAPIACCIAATPSPITCPAATTTTTAAPFVCPYATNPTPQASTEATTQPSTPTQASTVSPTTLTPSSSTLTARNPDPNPTPNYIVVPSNPGMPNMPFMPNMPYMYPYPMFGSYMPIVEDPTTGQRYYVMPNPNRRTNKYTQTFNIYSPDMNPGYYAIPSTVAPISEENKNETSTEKASDKS